MQNSTPNIERELFSASSGRFQRKQAFSKRIGSTLYEVNVYFKEAGKETLEDKIFRLIENEPLQSHKSYVNVKGLQTERPPERGTA